MRKWLQIAPEIPEIPEIPPAQVPQYLILPSHLRYLRYFRQGGRPENDRVLAGSAPASTGRRLRRHRRLRPGNIDSPAAPARNITS
jgi:hypothetical protein